MKLNQEALYPRTKIEISHEYKHLEIDFSNIKKKVMNCRYESFDGHLSEKSNRRSQMLGTQIHHSRFGASNFHNGVEI